MSSSNMVEEVQEAEKPWQTWRKHHIREEVGRGTEVSESRWSVVISCKINVNTSRKLLFLCSCQTEGIGAIKTIGKLF